MSAEVVILAVAALLIGATGTWSPCGFSMIETIGVRGAPGARATTIAACATFAPGALVGGLATFGLLAAAGELVHGVGGTLSYLVAAAIAVLAAAAEARGVRIVPQVRRQLPETWRWRMPLPVAAGLYGVLLGLGFTTFVLSFGAWALAAISFAVGDPAAGIAIGLAFGIGRALPIVVLAPLADHPLGIRCVELMAERPALYARARLSDALALLAVAGAMTVSAASAASPTDHIRGADPSAAGHAVAFQRGDHARAFIRRGGHVERVHGREPAAGGHFVVTEVHGSLSIRRKGGLHEVSRIHPGPVWASAVSNRWLVYGQSRRHHDLIKARPLHHGRPAGPTRVVERVRHPIRLGHPGVFKGIVAYAIARRNGDAVVWQRLGAKGGGTVARTHRGALCCASVHRRTVLYVLSIRARQGDQVTSAPPLQQELLVHRIGSSGARQIYSRGGSHGTLFSTALSRNRAYATVLHRRSARMLAIPR